jgi:hypothetical protein
MATLTKRMKTIEIVEKIDEALWKWYFERGREVPNWKKTDPQWWIDYLRSLDEPL